MYRRTQDDPVLEEVDAMVNVNLTKPIILAVKILFIIGYIAISGSRWSERLQANTGHPESLLQCHLLRNRALWKGSVRGVSAKFIPKNR
jgi:hypothetical protein